MATRKAKPRLKLFACDFCPYSERVIDRLDVLGPPYELEYVPHYGGREEVLKLTGQPLVPVLVDGKRAINGSGRILEYLNRTYGDR
jgi:glutathione S-transferase